MCVLCSYSLIIYTGLSKIDIKFSYEIIHTGSYVWKLLSKFMVQCPKCEIQLTSEGFLNRHLRTMHSSEKFISKMD